MKRKATMPWGDYLPIQIQTAEDEGIRMLIKTCEVPQGTHPQALIEKELTRRGVEYQVSDILKRELTGKSEEKQVSQTVTIPSETDDADELLSLLDPTIPYNENGYTGTLTLDQNFIRAKAEDTTGYTYTIKDAQEFTGLARNNPYYIPKTIEKNGGTLGLADIPWTPMSGGLDSRGIAIQYNATALYTGTGCGSKADELGLYDMSSNAYEWVDDYAYEYPDEEQVDPQHTPPSRSYVKRGGSNYHGFDDESYLFTTTGRYFYGSTDRTIRFRIALR